VPARRTGGTGHKDGWPIQQVSTSPT